MWAKFNHAETVQVSDTTMLKKVSNARNKKIK
jgi:hypothetical protein